MYNYLVHTEDDIKQLLDSIGLESIEDLFKQIPESLKNFQLNLPDSYSELELCDKVEKLALKNRNLSQVDSFLGAGVYNRYIPKAVFSILQRSEFYTAYTPYQPEISQGTLQSIYEFQSMICFLTGMDVANASMYDGASAAAEALLMAVRLTKKNKILVPLSIHPEYRQVMKTYTNPVSIELIDINYEDGVSSLKEIEKKLDNTCAAVIIQTPNFFGCLEKISTIADLTHKTGALFIVISEPVSLGILKSPGENGADIVVGDCQSIGNLPYFGGPHIGFIACKEKYLRQLPGRIVGATVDVKGERCFTLTLQTREQHIRREKATSNICSNQALNALATTVYLSLLGKHGLKEVANISLQRAHYLANKINKINGIKLAFNNPFFNEFVIKCDAVENLLNELLKNDIIGGVNLSRWYPELQNHLLICVTEMNSIESIDRFVISLEKIINS